MEQDPFLAVKRNRTRSWVGVEEEKPHAYLREAMVSKLMSGICDPEAVGEVLEPRRIDISPEREKVVADAVGTWEFSAHQFSDDELLQAALVMLQHALTMQDLDRWRISTDDLTAFILAARMAYNAFVPYHNFRHVVDVLQAVFYFLLQLGALPPYPSYVASPPSEGASPLASLLRPFEALTLLITAIGHDVGHPGVNNAFLVNLKAPLAQLYNDRSVLESFHCAAFSQILRRYWPASFLAADMRKLLINTILATDMGLHFDYMKKLAQLQQTVHANTGIISENSDAMRDEWRTLVCSLLIKCADISNVARTYDVAANWASILTDEFARQASMEADLGIPTALFAPPVRDSIVELGKSQIGFMNLFALPLFQGVADVLPSMHFSVDEILTNKKIWESKIEQALDKERTRDGALQAPLDGGVSPRSRSVSRLSQSPEHHPPAIIATPPCDALASLSPAQREQLEIDLSPRSSFAPVNGGLPEVRRQSERTSWPGPGPSSYEGSPHRSSGASPTPTNTTTTSTSTSTATTTIAPALRPRRSSNTMPGQFPLGMASPENRRASADRSVVAVLVTSPGRNSKTGTAPTTSSSQPSRHAQRHSSEKGSLPSSNEWQSQATSPTNVTYSPATEATSFMSEASSDKAAPNGHSINGSLSEPLSMMPSAEGMNLYYPAGGGGAGSGGPGTMTPEGSLDPVKTIRHRPSRWRLNFWRSRRKTPCNGGSP